VNRPVLLAAAFAAGAGGFLLCREAGRRASARTEICFTPRLVADLGRLPLLGDTSPDWPHAFTRVTRWLPCWCRCGRPARDDLHQPQESAR
jgi:hypothetical protein